MAISGVSGFHTIAAAGSDVKLGGIGSGIALKMPKIISRDVMGIPMAMRIPSGVLSARVTSGVSEYCKRLSSVRASVRWASKLRVYGVWERKKRFA